ncbi:putative methyltransferase-like protein 15 [Stylophora pistillata]|uniref:Putative methyltransferase-like protein 15 n=1 Tax=Stylophora pistillata TaxID=50429 RepID=A0A2B4R3E5_STYPI|nr:putative methyltransferase-like protein 15 [Stylophora pistillata]
MYPALKSYFLSNTESNPRIKRLKQQFADPMVELYHLFFQAVLPTFTFPNKFLQREDPCIYAAHGQLNEFVRLLLGKFVQIEKIKTAKTVDKKSVPSQKLRYFCTQGDSHTVHVLVMLKECLSFLAPCDGQVSRLSPAGSACGNAFCVCERMLPRVMLLIAIFERYQKLSADVVNSINETELTAVLRQYGQEKEAVRISRAIAKARSKMPSLFTRQLAAIVTAAVRHSRSDRFARPIHPATRTFPALRILVNDELNELQCVLKAAHKLLRPRGRLVVISFHALEDSLVRRFFKDANSEVSYMRSRTNVAGKAKKSAGYRLTRKLFTPPERKFISILDHDQLNYERQ